MAESVQIAVFSGGALTIQRESDSTREAVLGLPLGRLLVKVARAESKEVLEETARPQLQALSPYPDDEITVASEILGEDASGVVALVAALPEAAADDIGEALDAAKLSITRIDAIALGMLREQWADIEGASVSGEGASRRLVLVDEGDDIAMFVLDGGVACAARAVAKSANLRREAMLMLMEAEDFAGPRPLKEVVTLGDVGAEELNAFASVRNVALVNPEKRGVDGIAARSTEGGSLDALPGSWRQMLYETRFKAKLKHAAIVAAGIWVFIVAIMFGVPITYGFMTDHQRSLSREHSRRYNEVKEMREKVRLVQKYSDHSRGALEILKAVSDRLPGEIELNNWNFRRDEEGDAITVRFSGESDDAASVYKFKDALLAMAIGEGEDAERVFADVRLTGPSAAKGGKQKFDIECTSAVEEDQ